MAAGRRGHAVIRLGQLAFLAEDAEVPGAVRAEVERAAEFLEAGEDAERGAVGRRVDDALEGRQEWRDGQAGRLDEPIQEVS